MLGLFCKDIFPPFCITFINFSLNLLGCLDQANLKQHFGPRTRKVPSILVNSVHFKVKKILSQEPSCFTKKKKRVMFVQFVKRLGVINYALPQVVSCVGICAELHCMKLSLPQETLLESPFCIKQLSKKPVPEFVCLVIRKQSRTVSLAPYPAPHRASECSDTEENKKF